MADTKQTGATQHTFEEYREKMHPEETPGRTVVPKPHRPVAIAFGIFMIIVYVGVGVLFLINYFGWELTWARLTVGILLILYGIYRGYRQFSGNGYY